MGRRGEQYEGHLADFIKDSEHPFGGMGLARTDRSRPFPPDVPVLHEA